MMEPPNPVRRSLRTLIAAVAAVVALLVPLGLGAMASADSSKRHEPRPTIVLVHGDWADGSSWSGVIARLQREGFTVVAPPNPLRGPSFDAPYLNSYLQTISGPIVLVAHSYGGFVITNAALGNPNIKALVYIDSFLPDEGEDPVDLLGNSGSCIIDPANSAFNFVPTPGGGTDLYLRVAPNRPTPASPSASPTASTRRTRPCSQPSSGPPRSNNSFRPRAHQPGRRSHRGR